MLKRSIWFIQMSSENIIRNNFFFISGICLFLFKQYSLVDSYNCSHFESGCPNTSFVSYKLFERKSCRSENTILFEYIWDKIIPRYSFVLGAFCQRQVLYSLWNEKNAWFVHFYKNTSSLEFLMSAFEEGDWFSSTCVTFL